MLFSNCSVFLTIFFLHNNWIKIGNFFHKIKGSWVYNSITIIKWKKWIIFSFIPRNESEEITRVLDNELLFIIITTNSPRKCINLRMWPFIWYLYIIACFWHELGFTLIICYPIINFSKCDKSFRMHENLFKIRVGAGISVTAFNFIVLT